MYVCVAQNIEIEFKLILFIINNYFSLFFLYISNNNYNIFLYIAKKKNQNIMA